MNQPPPYYGPYGPPPPKKGMSTGAVVAITLGSIVGGLVLLGAIASVGDDGGDRVDAKPTRTAAARPSTQAADAPTKAAPKATAAGYGDGDYMVGEDIPAGTYVSTGAQAGIFELCSITTAPTAKGVMPQWKTGNKDERVIITLTAEDGVVSISGCEPLKRRN
ncbi:hypothetical protein [Streptomyces sp. NPDC048338]|uniref:hypothetical protein n=1 Tax=Streptomyces sp. NPDC048338 TaxID=3365536 RepID=UPI0037105781